MTEPLKQLPHVRSWIGPDGKEHIGSLIGVGFEARANKVPLNKCPYGDEDPDGRAWWCLGWIRCDMHEVRGGRASLFSDVRQPPAPRKPSGPTMGIK
jgi:hypothetical protein